MCKAFGVSSSDGKLPSKQTFVWEIPQLPLKFSFTETEAAGSY